MYAIELLVAEHENISRLTHVMYTACLRIIEGGTVDVNDFRLAIAFIRTYADTHHHGKEEAYLFKEMQAHLGTAAQTLVQSGMLVEHDLGRLYVKQLDEAVTAFAHEATCENKLEIIANAMGYRDLLRRHIERENGAVYPFAQRRLTQDILDLLNIQTHEFEKSNSAQSEHQLAVLAQLEEKYSINKCC